MRHIRLYEDFKKQLIFDSEKEIEMTFRFLMKKDIKSETLKRKIKERFIERIKPPFNFNDLTFYSFDIDFICDVPYKNNRMASEYAIKAKVAVEPDAPKNSKDLDKMIKVGLTQFLKLEEDEYFKDEVEQSIVISFEYVNV